MTYDAIFSHLPATRPLHLLDIGCSTCTEGQQLLDRGITLTGIDQDGATLDEVRARLPGATFLTMNAADIRICAVAPPAASALATWRLSEAVMR